MRDDEVMATSTAPPDGLSSDEARSRLRRDGANLLPPPPRPHPLRLLTAQLVHFFALMLWTAALLAWVAGMPALAVAIAVVVLLNGVFSFAQEFRADRAAERLRDLMPLRVTVRRDGRAQVVDAADLVLGDLVLLGAGDRVGADLTVVEASRLTVDESMLTGESTPVHVSVGDHAHAGTYVVEGQGAAQVVAVGAGTRLAGITRVTQGARRPPSPLAVQLHHVVRVLAVVAVSVGAVFFGLGLALGQDSGDSFLLAIGVTVALVPEGLLPTVTLSLARAAQQMATRHALVRRLESVETLGATTFICTDKTGTLTRNQMSVVTAWTPAGAVDVEGDGYAPEGRLVGSDLARTALRRAARSASRCVPDAHAVAHSGTWQPVGDPMEVALTVLARRADVPGGPPPTSQNAFDPNRRRSSVVDEDGAHVIGAPDAVLPRCSNVPPGAEETLLRLTSSGLRVLAVATKPAVRDLTVDEVERDLELLAVLGLQDPPRSDVGASIAACRRAGIRIAMVTGDHPLTAAAIARQVGLVAEHPVVLRGDELPRDDQALGELLDHDEVVVARVTPEDKLRVARALQARGHVVAMTGDGVNDGPALRTADIGIAMGASGTDVAREAADVVLLDDHFGTIVGAVELGRATFANIRRFLTYHLTDNVAELTPFVVWALSGGRIPLALTVLQVLALDIGTDQLPALALGTERPDHRTMDGPRRMGPLIDKAVAGRAFGVLGPAEAAWAMVAFLVVLTVGDWRFGQAPPSHLLTAASGTAFSAVVLGQLANAFACRSETRPVGRMNPLGNRLLVWAVLAELVLLLAFLALPPLPELLGGTFPDVLGWCLAATAVPIVLAVDTAYKARRSRRRR
jgi:magnesium-transporting ATPase (P-type)